MKHLHTVILSIIAIFIVGFFLFPHSTNDANKETLPPVVEDTLASMEDVTSTPSQHASVLVEWANNVIYVDPAEGEYDGLPIATMVLITDIHGDHFNLDTLKKVIDGNTFLIVPKVVAEQIPESVTTKVLILANGQTIEPNGFKIEAVPMYNVPESEDAYHVKGRGNGYVIEHDDLRVYVAGDTGPTKEMREMKNIDIAFVPMNLPYTMTIEEAASAVLDFTPRRVYPYHYRSAEGLSDVRAFAQLIEQGSPYIEVVQEQWYPEFSL